MKSYKFALQYSLYGR